MQRYIIIHMYRTEEISSDVHDLSIEDCSRRAEELRSWAHRLKAALFLADMGSDLAVGDAFAEVEHNFPLSEEQKRELAGMLAPFFRDGTIECGELKIFTIPYAVRFLQTEGELLLP